MKHPHIHVKRYQSGDVATSIEPEDRSWQLLVDAEGVPHLLVRATVEMEDGTTTHGYLAIDDVLPGEMSIKDLMQSTFGGECDPAEVDGIQSKAPCPR